jgi:hypothetical protein
LTLEFVGRDDLKNNVPFLLNNPVDQRV